MSSYEELLDDLKEDWRDLKRVEEQTTWPPCPDTTCDGVMNEFGNDEAVCTRCDKMQYKGFFG